VNSIDQSSVRYASCGSTKSKSSLFSFSLSVPPFLASAEPAFFTAEPAAPTVVAATSNATPMTSINRESMCFLRI